MAGLVDWQCSRCLADCNRYMLDNQIECDVAFTLTSDNGDRCVLRAHRFVLISRSPVFFAMLSGPLAEKGQDIQISDIDPEPFKQLLRYLYEEDVSLTIDNVFHILYAAKKYLVTSLSKACTRFLRSALNPDNVSTVLEFSYLVEDDPELLSMCGALIRQQSRRVFYSDAFYRISRDTLARILKAETLSIQEVDVFRACLRWAKHKCSEAELDQTGNNHRRMLANCIRSIHLPTLSIGEFTEVVLPAEVLSPEEENLIFRFMLNVAGCRDNAKDFLFPTNNRERVERRSVFDYHGFARHMTSLATLPQRQSWFVTIHSDHVIRLMEIGFIGRYKGAISVSQNGFQKLQISCDVHVTQLRLEEDGISLDAGLFTIATEPPCSYLGDYYFKQPDSGLPSMSCYQDTGTLLVRDVSTSSFLSYIAFIPTEEMQFIDDYYDSD